MMLTLLEKCGWGGTRKIENQESQSQRMKNAKVSWGDQRIGKRKNVNNMKNNKMNGKSLE